MLLRRGHEVDFLELQNGGLEVAELEEGFGLLGVQLHLQREGSRRHTQAGLEEANESTPDPLTLAKVPVPQFHSTDKQVQVTWKSRKALSNPMPASDGGKSPSPNPTPRNTL